MLQKISFTFFSFIFCYNSLLAQLVNQDTMIGKTEDVFVTATRSERKFSNLAVPAIIVNKKSIQQTGSLKLQDVLQEQTGIVIVNSNLATSLAGYPNPFGQGVQMLGLDPAYTAILLDGEPLVGRNAGILKLGRIATGNIQQIEIVKGPSSSLYGSEAMAGVINIITARPTAQNIDVQLHTATNNTNAQTVSYANRFNKTGIQFFVNRYSTSGYDLDKNIYGKTIDPYRDWTMHAKITHDFSAKTQFLLSLRNVDSKQNNDYQITWQSQPAVVKGFTEEKDRSIFAQLRYNRSANSRIYFRTFFNNYSNKSFVNLENQDVRFDETSFNQTILKPEIQFEHSHNSTSKYIAGVGAYFETIEASRYAGKQRLATVYAFTQNEWSFYQDKLTLVAGIRLDKRTDFDLNVSPRIAAAFRPNRFWKITASAGWGFKAPDFRHMYLSFYNAQIGYSLIGSSVLANELQNMQQHGALQAGANINPYLSSKSLMPEKSFGTHFGTKFTKGKINIEAGIFRNDISNLIDVYLLPFKKTNNSNIYSYQNINRIFTQGADVDVKYQLFKSIAISAGYQYLEAKDKDILSRIEAGNMYKRDPVTYQSSVVKKADYFGINNRSKHTVNAKILWTNEAKGWNAFVRFVYRGKFGFNDINGNNIADDERELVPGFWMTNIAASKNINQKISLQVGVENLMDYTNAAQLPNIAGRIFFINLHFSFNHFNHQ